MQLTDKQKWNFLEDGFTQSNGPLFDTRKCQKLHENALAYVNIEEMFRSEEDYIRQPTVPKTKENPRGGANPGRGVANLAERLNLKFIEENEVFNNYIEGIVGTNYEVLLKKFVCGVPLNWIPDWIKAKMTQSYFDNLNAYLKLEYRDITYFRGIDYHMDIMDRVDEKPDIITIYIYLQDVNKDMSPLHVIKKSHKYAHTVFPHFRLEETASTIELGEDENNYEKLDKEILTGNCGECYFWSSLTMHGTQPTNVIADPRISLRYTIKKNPENSDSCLIDEFLKKKQSRGFSQH